MRDQYLAWLGSGLQPRSQIHGAADDGVVHSILTTKVADRAESSVDSHAYAEWTFKTAVLPLALELALRCCISTAMATQALASSATPFVSGSPKKAMIASPTYLSRVAPYLRAIPAISLRYRLRIEVSSSCKVEIFSGLGKTYDVRKENGEFLPVRCDLYLLPSLENRCVNLRCQIFGKLA